LSLDDLVLALIRKLKGKGYELICIDAIYSVLGDREENNNEDIAQIGALLFKLAKETGAAVVFSHHFSKGAQTGKRGIEKASGAGAWGRFPDASLAIDRHPDPDCYNFETTYRSFAPQPAFVARRNGGIWSVEHGKKPESTTASGNGADPTELLDVLAELGEASPLAWFESCKSILGLSRQAFDRRKKKAKRLIDEDGKTSNKVCRLRKGVAKDSETGRYVEAESTFKPCSMKNNSYR
jgi:AAA domain